jgi:hypothetical protein
MIVTVAVTWIKADHVLPSIAEVKNAQIFASISQK